MENYKKKNIKNLKKKEKNGKDAEDSEKSLDGYFYFKSFIFPPSTNYLLNLITL